MKWSNLRLVTTSNCIVEHVCIVTKRLRLLSRGSTEKWQCLLVLFVNFDGDSSNNIFGLWLKLCLKFHRASKDKTFVIVIISLGVHHKFHEKI